MQIISLLISLINSTGPSTDPWGTLYITGLHLDIETATLWIGPFHQFLIHLTIHPSNPYLFNITTKCGWHNFKSRERTSEALSLFTRSIILHKKPPACSDSGMIPLGEPMLAISITSLVFMCFAWLPGGSVPWCYEAWRWGWLISSFQRPFLYPLY